MKARCIQDSEIAHAPPHIREIWDWLLKEANHEDKKYSGIVIKRGQCLRSYADIQEGLSWKIGWRKQQYTKGNCETSMKYLKRTEMITTRKTTRGMLITICNYDLYQDPKSYENHRRTTKDTIGEPQYDDTINKNYKKKEVNKGFDDFLGMFNNLKKTNFRKNAGIVSQFDGRIKDGYTLENIKTAITNCMSDKYHQENPKYLTPEFILRPKQIEAYLNYQKPKEERQPGLYGA